jgi:hypothetical protein
MRVFRLLPLPLLLIAAAGCGGPSEPTQGPAGGPSAPPGATALQVAVDNSAVYTLRCGGPAEVLGVEGAELADAVAACGAAYEHRELLVHGPPPGLVCTQQYGGSERAQITGTLEGETVNLTLTRTDGCGIANWDALQPLLGAPGEPPGGAGP